MLSADVIADDDVIMSDLPLPGDGAVGYDVPDTLPDTLPDGGLSPEFGEMLHDRLPLPEEEGYDAGVSGPGDDVVSVEGSDGEDLPEEHALSIGGPSLLGIVSSRLSPTKHPEPDSDGRPSVFGPAPSQPEVSVLVDSDEETLVEKKKQSLETGCSVKDRMGWDFASCKRV